MMHRPLLLTAAIALVFLLSWKRPTPIFHVDQSGIVVDHVDLKTASATGLMPGDVLVSWTGEFATTDPEWPSTGEFGSPFDLLAIEKTIEPAGPIRLTFDRDGGRQSTILPVSWQLSSRPKMHQHDLVDYLTGQQLLKNDNPTEGLARWNDLARRMGRQREHRTAAWLFFRIGQVLIDLGDSDRADQAFQAALEEIESAGDEDAEHLIRVVRSTIVGA